MRFMFVPHIKQTRAIASIPIPRRKNFRNGNLASKLLLDQVLCKSKNLKIIFFLNIQVPGILLIECLHHSQNTFSKFQVSRINGLGCGLVSSVIQNKACYLYMDYSTRTVIYCGNSSGLFDVSFQYILCHESTSTHTASSMVMVSFGLKLS